MEAAKKRANPSNDEESSSSSRLTPTQLKRQCIDSNQSSDPLVGTNNVATCAEESGVVDIASSINLNAGDRIEVRWEISDDATGSTMTRWWGGILTEPDGRMYSFQEDENGVGSGDNVSDKATVPIRAIDYDPFPPTFPDRSLEDVCFLTNHSLMNLESLAQSCWRREGDGWEPSDEPEEAIAGAEGDTNDLTSLGTNASLQTMLNSVLDSVLQQPNFKAKLNKLEPSQQCILAEKVANAKEKLASKLAETLRNSSMTGGDGVITSEHVKDAVEGLGSDLHGK